jgi:hypothetical protein
LRQYLAVQGRHCRRLAPVKTSASEIFFNGMYICLDYVNRVSRGSAGYLDLKIYRNRSYKGLFEGGFHYARWSPPRVMEAKMCGDDGRKEAGNHEGVMGGPPR